MANFMDYLKNASNEMANIARQQQADQARAQLEAVRQAQREEAERQRAEREAEAARKRAEEEAKVRKAQAEADAKRADAEAKAMKNIKDKFSTAKNWLTSEDYDKNLGGFASDVAKEAGTGINNALKNLTVDAPAVALDAASTNLQNNLQRQYVGAIDEFGQAQYDEVMNPDYTPVKNTNYGDIFRNNPLADLYGAIDESLANDLRGTRVGGFTEGVTQQIPNAIAGNIAGPMASLGLMGTEVFGSSGQQALDQGATPGRAALYGLANAGVELGTEAINPGIPGVNMDAGLMPLVGEGLEELIGGIADPYTEIALGNKNIVDATQEAFSKENLKSALEQGISGALSAGVMNAGQMMLTNPQGVADRVTGNNDYKRAINDINSQLEIAEQAVALNPNDVDAQMQRDNLLASRTMAQRMFATPENLNSDDSVTRNAARQANMDIIEATARTSGANLSPSEVRNIASIANKVGARVEFTSEPINGTDGFQDANGVLQINANAKDPVMTIFAHELTHATQGSRQYQQLHDTLVDMAKSGEISVDKLDGLASNPNLTEQQKYDETVATLAQEVFGNSDAIQNLANRNGSLIDRAIQTAKDFMSGNNSVTKAERAMQRAIKNADTRNLTSSNAYTRGEFPFADAVGETINVKDIGEHRSKLPYAVQEMANKLLKTNGSEEAVAKVLKKNGSQTPNYPDSAEYKRLMPQITEFIQSAKSRGVDSIKYENGQFVEVVNEKKPSKKKAEPVATEKTAEQKEAEKKARIEKFLKEQEALEKRRTSKETKPAFDFDAAVAKAKEENKFKDLGEAHTSTDIDASLSKEAQKSLEKEQREIKKEEEAKQREEKAEKEAEEKAERKGQRADINMLKSQFQYIYGLNNNGKEYKKHDVYASNVMDKINKQLEKAGMTYEELQERMMREAMGIKTAEVDANDPWTEQLENAKEELRFLKEKYNADILDEEINEYTDIDDALDDLEFFKDDTGASELSPDEYDRLLEEYKNAKSPSTTSANEEPVLAEEQKETKIPDEQETYDSLMASKKPKRFDNTNAGITEDSDKNKPLSWLFNVPLDAKKLPTEMFRAKWANEDTVSGVRDYRTGHSPLRAKQVIKAETPTEIANKTNEWFNTAPRERSALRFAYNGTMTRKRNVFESFQNVLYDYANRIVEDKTGANFADLSRAVAEWNDTHPKAQIQIGEEDDGIYIDDEKFYYKNNEPTVEEIPTPAAEEENKRTPREILQDWAEHKQEFTPEEAVERLVGAGEEYALKELTDMGIDIDDAETLYKELKEAQNPTVIEQNGEGELREELAPPSQAEEPAATSETSTELEEAEPISVNDYVTDGDSIAEVIDMEDGQLTLRYENGVTETVDDNGLWNKTETPTQAETQQIKEPQQSESKANVYKVGDKVSVNGNSGQVTAVYSNGAVFVKFDKTDVNGLIVQPNDFDTVFNSKATSPVQEKPVEPEPPVADKPSTEPSPVKAKPAKETEEVVEESKSEATENWSTVKDIKKGTTVYRDGVPYRFDGWGKDELGKTGYRFTDEYGRTTVYSSKAANELLKNGELQARPLISRDDSRIQEIADKYGIKDTNAVYRGLNEIARTGTSQELWNSFNGGSYEEHLKAMNDIANKIGVPDNEFSKIISQNAKPKTKPAVEKTKDGEVKVNETELKQTEKGLSSDDPKVKDAAKETLKKDVESLTDGSEAGKRVASASVDEFGDAIDKIRDRKEELRKTNETQTNKYNTSDKTKSIQKEQKKSGAKEESHEFVSDVDAETTAEEYYQKFGHEGIYESYKNRKNSRNKLVSMYDISVVATWIDHNNDIRNQYMKENGITRKGERTYLDKDGNRLKKDSDQYARLQVIDQQELDMANKLSELSSHAGSALHIVQSVLKNISPTTKRNMFNIEIDKLNRRIEKMFKKQLEKGTVKLIDHLSDEEWDAYYNAETDQARKAAMDAIEKRVGQSIPATWGDRLRAIRYLNMLFNPATHIRNFGGNLMTQQLTDMKNANAYVLDKLAKPVLDHIAKKGGQEYVSSYHDANGKAVTVSSKADRGLLDYWDNYRQTQIEGVYDAERKYSNGAGSSFNMYRNYFHKEGSKWNIPGRILDRLVKGNSNLLEGADKFFSNPRFRKEAARITKAEGWELKDGKLVKDGKEISDTTLMRISDRAMKEAMETTYHDINEFAKAINDMANYNVASDIVVGGTVPFTTTPFNIARRTYEYSPVGLLINTISGYGKVCNGEMSANTYLNNIAKGLTGTQIAALGWFLAKMGLLVGHKKEEWQEQAYKEDVGLEQDYSLVIPKQFRLGKNNQNQEDIEGFYSIDWGGPLTSAMLLGAQAYEELDNKAEKEYGTGIDAFVNKADHYSSIASGILSPLVETTSLSSFQGALDNYYYDKKNGGDGFGGMAKGIATNYLGQFTPTLGGKINNTIDPIKRSSYSNNSLGSFWRQQVKKIPFADEAYALAHDGEHYLEPSINVKGEEERQEGKTLASRAALNFMSPGNWTSNKATETDYELLRLYEDTMDADILPTSIKKVKGEELTPKARTTVNKDYGKAYADETKSYLSSQAYKNSDNKHRTTLLEKVQKHNKLNAEVNYYNEAGLDGDSLLEQKDISANFLKDRGMDNWRAYETFSITNDLDKEGDSIKNSGALRKRVVYQNQGVWDDIVADIKAHEKDSNYPYNAYGLNKTVVGWNSDETVKEWNDLLNISNSGEINLLDGDAPKGSGKTNNDLSTGTGSATGGRRSSGRSGRTSSTAKDADFELFEKILKGEIKATKSAVSTIAKSLKSLDAKTYDEIMNKHKKMMNELELYGM